MATKRVTTILIALMIAVLAVYSGSEAADENTMAPAVYMNDLPGPLSVKKPDPVHIMTFILAGQWVDKPFELYIFTGEGSGTYLGSDLAWNAYDSQHPLQPLISSGMPDYQGLHLPSFANLLWTAFNDSSVLADGDTVLTVCIDINMDGSLNAAESACGTMTIHVEKPACVLSLSPKVIPTKTITAGTNVQSETIAVSDSCNSSAFTVSVQSGGEWLSPQSVENTITLTYNSAGLSSRSEPYIGKILVTSSGGATDFITTSLTVLPKSTTCALAANPGQVNFTGSKSSIFPVVSVSNSPAAVAVTDCNGNVPGSLGVTIDTASKGWLSAARNALDGSLSVSVNGSGVGGTGTFRGTVTVTAAGASLNIPVTLVVSGSEPQTCSVSFPELSFGGAAGTVTSSQTVAVSDSCGNIKSFSSVAPSAGWISVNPTSGTGKFDVTVNSMPSVTTTGSISLRVDGVTYSFNVTAMPTGPACTTPTKVKLYDTSGGAISSLSVSGTTSGILSQTVGVRDDCSKAYTTYTFTYPGLDECGQVRVGRLEAQPQFYTGNGRELQGLHRGQTRQYGIPRSDPAGPAYRH
ncbi:MAG: BACON domain-containing protein [Nitrospirae bacterium]|nr:BACON domain-containing protein [Nitrospirota bacterium]